MWKIFSASPFLVFINNISNLSNILRYTSPAEQSKPNGTSLCQSSTLRISHHLCITAPGWLCHKELCSLSCQVFCSSDRAHDIQSLLPPGWSLCIYSCSSPHRGLLPKRAQIPGAEASGIGNLTFLCLVREPRWWKGFPGCSVGETFESCALLERGDAFAWSRGVLALLVLLFQSGAARCSKEFHELFLTNPQMLLVRGVSLVLIWFIPVMLGL